MVLDVLLDRAPHVQAATRLFALVERGRIRGLLGATTVTTVYYLARKALGKDGATRATRDLLSLFEIAAVNRAVLEGALEEGWSDFEDSVLHQAGVAAAVEGIVTRNPDDFRGATVPVYAPSELLRMGPAPSPRGTCRVRPTATTRTHRSIRA